MKRSTGIVLGIFGLVAGVVGAWQRVLWLRGLRLLVGLSEGLADPDDEQPPERRRDPDPRALEALTSGEAARLGMDIDKLKEMGGSFEPLIEYLTYIQIKRGEKESLVFVRRRDLDALAALSKTDREVFVDELQRLGVMLSMN